MERLHAVELVPGKPEPGRGKLVEIARIGRLLFGQHTTFARTDPRPGQFGPTCERDLGRFRQGAVAHVRHQERDLQPQRFLCIRLDHHIRPDRVLVKQRKAVQLRGQDLDVVPSGQVRPGHAHGYDDPVMAGLAKPVAGVALDQPVERFFLGAVAGIGVKPQISLPVEGLRVVGGPGGDFVRIDPNLALVPPSAEFHELFVIGIFRHPGVEPVIPMMHAAYQVVAIDKAVGHQCPPVQTAPIHHRDVVTEPDNDQIHFAHQRVGRRAVTEVGPLGNGRLFHVASLVSVAVAGWRAARDDLRAIQFAPGAAVIPCRVALIRTAK